MNDKITYATQLHLSTSHTASKKPTLSKISQGLLASLCVTFLLASGAAQAATAPNLGTAATFGVLSSTYTNTGAGTTITGDLGYTTGPAMAPDTVSGTTQVANGPYTTAGLDQATALANLNGQSCTSLGAGAVALNAINVGSGPGVFPPGCYSSGGAMNITTGTQVKLSGPGVYIFRPGGALNPAANSKIVTTGGVCENDIFWAPTGATTLGANTAFLGTIIDDAGITLGNNATLMGRALSFGQTVTTDKNIISVPTCTGYTGTDPGPGPGPITPPGPGPITPPVTAEGIPTLSEWSMIMLAALLAAAAFVTIRKQKNHKQIS